MSDEKIGNEEAVQRPAFEALLEELEQRVRQLEAGELPLDEALDVYARGVTLVRETTGQLEAAELRIEELHKTLAGAGA